MDERLARAEARVEAELHHVVDLVHDLPFDRRFRAISLATLMHAALYFSANHFPLSEPRLLERSALDLATPFLPWTVVVYLSAYALAFVGYLSLRKVENSTRFLQVFFTCVVVAGLVHWAVPTTYPRALFPVPAGTDALSAWLLTSLRAVDTPSSCLPSLHVAISVVSALVVFRERPRLSLALFAWATAIAVSTLTTKQHYAVDVASGVLLAVAATVGVDLAVRRQLRDRPVR